jgi:hypothetical protein
MLMLVLVIYLLANGEYCLAVPVVFVLYALVKMASLE